MAGARDVVVRIRAEIGDFRRQMDQAATASRDLGRATQESGQQTQEALTAARAAAQAARSALNDAGKAAQDAAQGFGLSYNSAGRLTDQFGNLVTEAHAAELGLDTASDATREFAAQQQHAAGELAATTAAAGEATTHMGRLSASVRDHEDAWDKAGGTLLAFGAAVVAGVGLAIAKYAEFDKAMSEVSAATHETAGNMQLLRDAAITMGADTSFSAKEAADAISELSKAGVTTKDILNGGLAGALSLAAAGSLGVADAAELAATAMTQFKLSGEDLPHVADLLAAGAGKAQGSVEDMGAALGQAGLVADATGLSIEETTGTLAAFASAGLIGSDAGTSMKTMLQALTPSSKEAKAEMERLGISAYDAQGNFIGMAEFAGNLQTSLAGLTDEQRAATQKIIFGSDAVRASNVLYEQGEAGISGWIDKVNESGFAASTAAIKQDNLAGDLEKLGGSFDTVLIQGGGGAAQALRGVVQGLEGVIDAVGKVKPEFLGLATGMTAVVGITALLAGGFLTLVPKAVATHAAFRTLAATNAPLAAGLGRVAKVAGVAMVALLALGAIGAIFSDKQTTSAAEYANAIMKVSQASKGADSSGLDSLFQSFDKFGGSSTVSGVNNLSDAVGKLTEGGFEGWQANAATAFDGFTSMFNLPKSEIGQLNDKLKGLGETLGEVASNGGAESAAKTFSLLTEEFKKNGQGAQEALDKMPGYKDALLKLGQASGVALEPQELLELAAGKIPARMEAAQTATEKAATATQVAAEASEAMATALEDIGLSAEGAITSIGNFADALFAAGLLSLSASDASIAYQDSIDKMTESIKTNGTTLDITTEKGRANQSAYNGIAQAAMTAMTATAEETLATEGSAAAQAKLQTGLRTSYDDLVTAANQLGITGDAADAMARKALGIPNEVPIDTWVNDKATSELVRIKGVVDSMPTFKQLSVHVQYTESGTAVRDRASDAGMSNMAQAHRDGGLIKFADGGAVRNFATAGYVRGPGTGTSDEINARLSNGEYVIRASKVAQYGVKTFDAYNNGYADVPSKSMAGGYGQTQSFAGFAAGSASAGASNVTVSAPAVTVMIGNEQLDARMYSVAGSVVSSADSASQHTRRGRA